MTTLRQFLRACSRSWPLVVVGALFAAVAGFVAVSDDGVYYTRTELAFLAPTGSTGPNALQARSDSIIVTAGAVARAVTGPAELPKFASPDVTLVGAGIRDGWSLRLRDTGGQWASNFATQRLVLEVVGPTRESVAARQQELTREVASTLRALQAGQGADPAGHITMMAAPESAVIDHVTGSPLRAAGMTVLLGASVTVACAVILERRRRVAPTGGGSGSAAATPAEAASAVR